MARKDPVTPELYEAVWSRDQGCVAPLIDPLAGRCMNRWGGAPRSRSDYELDHVRDQPMTGKRAPSDLSHLAVLCSGHHQRGWATANRPALRRYLHRGLPIESATE